MGYNKLISLDPDSIRIWEQKYGPYSQSFSRDVQDFLKLQVNDISLIDKMINDMELQKQSIDSDIAYLKERKKKIESGEIKPSLDTKQSKDGNGGLGYGIKVLASNEIQKVQAVKESILLQFEVPNEQARELAVQWVRMEMHQKDKYGNLFDFIVEQGYPEKKQRSSFNVAG